MNKTVVDLRIEQLEEVLEWIRKLYCPESNRNKAKEILNYGMHIKEAIAIIKAQQEALKSYEEAIKKLKAEKEKLLLGDYFDKLKVQQNNLLSAIQGYLEDLKI